MSSGSLLRTVIVPLAVNHALILIGAFLLLAGSRWGTWSVLGAVLVGAGVSIEIAILVWSASLTRSASVRRAAIGPALTRPSRESHRRVCVSCGRVEAEGNSTCSRCGRVVVSVGSAR
jgi:hypothetical protein